MTKNEIRADALEVIGDGYYFPGEPEGGNPYIASHIKLAKACLALLAELEQAEALAERYETALRQIAALAELGQPADFLARHARAALNPQAHKTEGA